MIAFERRVNLSMEPLFYEAWIRTNEERRQFAWLLQPDKTIIMIALIMKQKRQVTPCVSYPWQLKM